MLLKHSFSRNDKVRRRLQRASLSLSLCSQARMNTCQGWRAAIITSFPCTFLSFRRGLYYNIRTAHVNSAWQRGKRRTCGGIRPALAHANIIGGIEWPERDERGQQRVGTSARFVPARHTAGSLPVYTGYTVQNTMHISLSP